MDNNDDEQFNQLLDDHTILLTTVLAAVEDHDDVTCVVGCETVDGLECLQFTNDENTTSEHLDQMWLNAPAAVFFVQRCKWTDLPEPAPTRDSWLVIVVVPGAPAIFFAKNIDHKMWSPFPARLAPWHAVSTAGAMRGAQQGKLIPNLLTVGDNQELFATPRELPLPPTNSEGIVG